MFPLGLFILASFWNVTRVAIRCSQETDEINFFHFDAILSSLQMTRLQQSIHPAVLDQSPVLLPSIYDSKGNCQAHYWRLFHSAFRTFVGELLNSIHDNYFLIFFLFSGTGIMSGISVNISHSHQGKASAAILYFRYKREFHKFSTF